jgi:Domain of unknown function (DUF4330)
MAIVDSQGRLFGKLSILDVGAGAVIALVMGGIFLFPGKTGSAVKGDAGKPVEVDVMVKGLSAADPKSLFIPGDKVNVIIRNEPSGSVEFKTIKLLPRTVAVAQPDGPEMSFSTDMQLTLVGAAQVSPDGIVFGNKKVKIGTTLELEGKTYNFNSTVIALRQKS